MPKIANVSNHIVAARRLLKTARTADELRQAQAVLLPVDLGLSLAQTAQAIGRSVGVTSTLRNAFGKAEPIRTERRNSPRPAAALTDVEAERQALLDILRHTSMAGTPSIASIKPLLEAWRGTTMSLSTVYRTLARHGWRRNAPFPAEWFAHSGLERTPDAGVS